MEVNRNCISACKRGNPALIILLTLLLDEWCRATI
ncbi:hypothetical protein GGR15_004407 [Butyricimonas paravirosa]|uniref:Uncharacterized protein n=1 Tax=Butyricimonas paravirosa TaxID=1472417 RepID=A0A7X5YGI5_9BACT|nr:hypothetical protein [Butyricimonas paravirosa]